MKSPLTRLVAVLAFATASTGCVIDRSIVRIEEQPEKKVSIVETVDQYPFVSMHQYWLCVDYSVATTCTKACGGYNDLACHTVAFGSSNLQ